MNKKKAAIILIALFAVSTCAVLDLPKAKAQNYSDIKILSYSTYISPADSYTSSAGDLVVVGEIQNQGNAVWDLPEITGFAYTTDGELAASAMSSAFVKDLLPNQKAPFYLDFNSMTTNPNGNYSGTLDWIPYLANVTLSLWAAPTNDSMYRGLTVSGLTSYSVGGVYSVTGYIQNTGNDLTGNVWAVTTFYNSTGGVVACNYTAVLTSSLAPNASVAFTATPMDNTAGLSSEITSYSVLVQNQPYVAPTPTPVSTETPAPTVSPGPSTSYVSPTQPAGSQHSSNSSTLMYSVIGAVIIVVAIGIMLLIRKRLLTSLSPQKTGFVQKHVEVDRGGFEPPTS